MFDDFENEDLFNDGNDEMEQIKMNAATEELVEKIIDRLVRENYKAIEKNGIDILHTKLYAVDEKAVVQLKYTLDFMLKYFISTEEYEKCAVLNKYIEELQD